MDGTVVLIEIRRVQDAGRELSQPPHWLANALRGTSSQV